MTDREWNGVVAILTADWPHQLPPEMALAKWRQDLDDIPAQDALNAVEALYADGREFAPNGGQILAKVRELEAPPLDADEAYALIRSCPFSFHGEHQEHAEALTWIAERSPQAAEAARRVGLNDLALYGGNTMRAQFRDAFDDVVESGRRAVVRERLERPQRGELRPIGEIAKQIAGDS